MKKKLINTLCELVEKTTEIKTYDDIMNFFADKVSRREFPKHFYNLLICDDNEKLTERQYDMKKSA